MAPKKGLPPLRFGGWYSYQEWVEHGFAPKAAGDRHEEPAEEDRNAPPGPGDETTPAPAGETPVTPTAPGETTPAPQSTAPGGPTPATGSATPDGPTPATESGASGGTPPATGSAAPGNTSPGGWSATPGKAPPGAWSAAPGEPVAPGDEVPPGEWGAAGGRREPFAPYVDITADLYPAPPESRPDRPLIRPYILTGGRTRPQGELAVHALIFTTGRGRAATGLPAECQGICSLCQVVRSVAEVAAMLTLPLGVARVLVDDLARAGLIAVSEPDPGSHRSAEVLTQVIEGLRRL